MRDRLIDIFREFIIISSYGASTDIAVGIFAILAANAID